MIIEDINLIQEKQHLQKNLKVVYLMLVIYKLHFKYFLHLIYQMI